MDATMALRVGLSCYREREHGLLSSGGGGGSTEGAKEEASCGLDLLSKEQTQARTFVVRVDNRNDVVASKIDLSTNS